MSKMNDQKIKDEKLSADEEEIHIKQRKENFVLEISINDKELIANHEKLFDVLDFIDRTNNFFELRNKFKDLFIVIPEQVIFRSLAEKWFEWEKVLLLLFTRFPYPTEREYIWKHDIKQVNLRNIIKDKKEFIMSVDEDHLLLTSEGLKYILEKLNH